MCSNTHWEGGVTAYYLSILPVIISYKSLNHTLGQSLLILPFILIICKLGSYIGTFAVDFDFTNYESVPMKSRTTYKVNRWLVRMGATHRSWHTHNLDINGIIFMFTSFVLLEIAKVTQGSLSLILFMWYSLLFSFYMGIVIHVVLDLFTQQGAHISYLNSRRKQRYYEKRLHRPVPLSTFRFNIMPEEFNVYRWKGFRLVKMFPFETYNRTGGDYEDWFGMKLFKMNKKLRSAVNLIIIILLLMK